MAEWNGEDRRVQPSRRADDFCGEHCLLKKHYYEEFKDIRDRKRKMFDHLEEIHERDFLELKKGQRLVVNELKAEMGKKAPLWVLIALIGILASSIGGSWFKLNAITNTLAEVKAKQEIVLQSHKFSAEPRSYYPQGWSGKPK